MDRSHSAVELLVSNEMWWLMQTSTPDNAFGEKVEIEDAQMRKCNVRGGLVAKVRNKAERPPLNMVGQREHSCRMRVMDMPQSRKFLRRAATMEENTKLSR